MEDVEKICKNCKYTLGGYGIPIVPDPTNNIYCLKYTYRSPTIVGKNYTCKWFKPIEKPKFNFDVPITFINWNGEG